MRDQRGAVSIILIIVGLFAVLGAGAAWIYIQNNQSTIEPQVEQSQADQQAQLTQNYPSLWAQANLPEYPNATIIQKREGRNLGDGVQVTFTTTDSKEGIKEFYNAEMSNRGFDVPTTPDTSELAYYGNYIQGNKTFTLQITKENDGTYKVLAKYVEL